MALVVQRYLVCIKKQKRNNHKQPLELSLNCHDIELSTEDNENSHKQDVK